MSKFLCYGCFVYVVVFYDDDFYIEFVILWFRVVYCFILLKMKIVGKNDINIENYYIICFKYFKYNGSWMVNKLIIRVVLIF